MRRKVELGVGAISLLRLMRSMRRLRGTRWDPFGRHLVRRTERELIGWYRETMDEALRGLNPENAGIVVEIARLPDLIRGYEDIKLANVARAKTRSRELARSLDERLGSRARSA